MTQILKSRTTPATLPASEAGAQLDVQFKRAAAIAEARDAIPKSYQRNTGAVLLAMGWAEARGIDLLTAIQTVSFVGGRPVIDATMQRALAEREGLRAIVTEATSTTATVRVIEKASGEVLGEATYTIDDATRAGLTNKTNWQNNPEDMLVARATTRAMRRYAPGVMVGLVGGEDELDEIQERERDSTLAALTKNAGEDQNPKEGDVASNPAGESEEPPAVNDTASESSPVEDAEVVTPITPATLARVTEAIADAKTRDGWGAIAGGLQGEGIELAPKKMTEEQAARVLDVLGGK